MKNTDYDLSEILYFLANHNLTLKYNYTADGKIRS